MNVAMIIGIAVQISLFLVVLSFGMQATLDDMLYLFRRPGQLVRALISINVIMPVFVALLFTLFDLNPIVIVALAALSVSPVPPILPNKVLKSGGGKSFTFGLLAALSVLSAAVIPLLFRILGAVFERHTKFSEVTIVKTILTGVLLPIVIGMVIRKFAPSFSGRYAGVVGKIGMVILLVVALPVLVALLPLVWSLVGSGTVLAIIAFAVVGSTAGYFLGGPNAEDRTALSLATASRHPGIAIALASANVDEASAKLAVAAIVLYLLISGIVMVPYLGWLSGGKTRPKEAAA
jgi:bile acid:Na+ symporter, BASS family